MISQANHVNIGEEKTKRLEEWVIFHKRGTEDINKKAQQTENDIRERECRQGQLASVEGKLAEVKENAAKLSW